MKRTYLVAIILLILAVPGAFAQYENIGRIINSKHDFSSSATASSVYVTAGQAIDTQICAYCHVAHLAKVSGSGTAATPGVAVPLWNHQLSSVAETGVYTSPTFAASISGYTPAPLPAATANWSNANGSLQCQSCHDGTVGVNAIYQYGQASGSNPNMTVKSSGSSWYNGTFQMTNANPSYIGTDLSGTHPINFPYTTAASNNTHIKAATNNIVTGASGAKYPLDNNGYMQCTTCHQSHDDVTYPGFLRASMNGSAMCLDCHPNQ